MKIKNILKEIKAFTLIEMLVVVLIIGILAAIAVPKYQKTVGKSRASQAVIILSSLMQAEQRYYLANNTTTENILDLDIVIPSELVSNTWTGTDSNKPSQYVFSCLKNSQGLFIGCVANAYNKNLPIFHRADYLGIGSGDNWCIGQGFGNKSSMASDVCEALGGFKQKGDRIASAGYYFMP